MRVLGMVPTFVLLIASTAQAQWPPSGLPLATGPNLQLFPDGIAHSDGSLHAFWIDGGPAPFAIYSQRVTPGGSLAPGGPAGRGGAIPPGAGPNDLVVQPDGQEGALLAWYDFRVTAEPRGIYGARVNATGDVATGRGRAAHPAGQAP